MPRTGKASLLIVFVTVFIDLLGFGIVLPLLPRYGEYFLRDYADDPQFQGLVLGLLLSSFSAMQFLFAPIWGRVSDRVGRRPILMLGLGGSTVFYAMFGWATGIGLEAAPLGLGALGWLFVSRIGAGIAGATIPTAQAYIADVTGPAERAKGMALIGAAFGIGFTFGPLLGAPFVPAVAGSPPSPAPGYVASVLSGLALLSAVFLLPESLKPESAPAGRHWFDVSSLKHALKQPAIGTILATMFLTTFAFAQFESTLARLTQVLGLSQRYNFYVFAYVGFVLALAQGFLVRRLVPKIGEFRMSLLGTLLMTVGLLLIGVAAQRESNALLYAVLPISVVGFAALTPSLQSLLSRNTDESEQGGVLGLGQSMAAMSRILGPIAGLVLFEMQSTYPFWAGAALMGGGILLVLALRTAVPAPSEESERAAPVSGEG